MLRIVQCAALALVVASALGGVSVAAPKKHPKRPAVPGELLVGFKAGVSEAEQDDALAEAGASGKKNFKRIKARLATTQPERVEAALKALEDDPRVRYAEPNYVVSADLFPTDPSFAQLWGLQNTGQSVNGTPGKADADIDAPEAWDVTTGSSGVVVAVVDTGVDFSHPDLGGSMTTSRLMWTNPGEMCAGCSANGVDDDGDGYVDDWRGWDFVNHDANPQDDNGHGSHVSGTIGALGNNGIGVTGVAWGGVRIMALKFLDASGYGSTDDAVSAILYAADHGAQILSNSWGGDAYTQALKDAIAAADSKGALFVAAAGNDALNTDVTPHFPSSYDVPNVLAVAATDQSDGLASFSNFGAESVDVGAPGTNIYSTVLGGGYDWYDGTSMATPHVTGAAVLVKARFPNATPAGIKALLMGTTDPLQASIHDFSRTAGRLNVSTAVHCSARPMVELEHPFRGFTAALNEPVHVVALAASCADPAGVTVAATGNGVSFPLVSRGDGVYTGTFTPTQTGPVTIAVSVTTASATATASAAGNALDTYRPVDEPYAWVDATSGGTNLALTADDGAVTTSLPFAFSYFRQAFSSVSVGSNGLLVFGGGSATPYNNLNLPHPQLPNGIVAPLWDDLNPSAGGAVWKKVVGTAPNRRVVFEWAAVPHYPQTGNATFEAILEEGSNDVVFQWQDVQFGSATYDFGANASIGVENLDASLGREWSYNTASLAPYEGAKAVRLTNGGTTAPPGPDTTPPAAPTGLTAAPGDGRVTLDWADNGEGDLGGYRVYRDGVLIASPTTSQWLDTGLSNGVAYAYRVTAVDATGNESAPSATVSATPVAAPVVRQYAPTTYTIAAGSLSSGGLSSLGAQDGNRLVVSSVRSSGSAVAEVEASATIGTAPAKLTVEWVGSCSKSASVTVRVWNWTTGAWQTIDGPTTTGSTDRTVRWSTTSPGALVSAAGVVRVDVRATRSQNFQLRSDLVRFTTES